MPRANRHRIPGQVWHITHRCHHRQFLLKFAKDRRAWVSWLYEARKRFGLCVLNYQVTSNHAHVLVFDRGDDEIASSMQLVAGRTGQDFNRRKARGGAFWEDRYHATAVDTDDHLVRCLVYIDLNMVRAGVVEHPQQWVEAGYHEIQRARPSYRIIDRAALSDLLAVSEDRLASVHEEWVQSKLACRDRAREPEWSDAIAVGRRPFVEQVQRDLGARGRYRRIEEANGTAILREAESRYQAHFAAEMPGLSTEMPRSRVQR
jgi:putative transposase